MTADATPARIHRIPTVVAIVKASPPCLTSQNEKVAATSIVPVAAAKQARPSAAMTAPRMRAERSARRSASPSLLDDRGHGGGGGAHIGDPSSSGRGFIR